MVRLLDECDRIFGSRDLYEVLSVPNTASQKEIKKAYYHLSLKVHPDRAAEGDKAAATEKFQVLSMVYVVLSDKEKKAIYDETGDVDDEDTLSEDRNWDNYWRALFPKITLADIEKYMAKYKGSDKELEDLKVYYVRFEGDLDQMSEHMPGYEVEDEDRYKETLRSLVASEDVPSFPKFAKETSAKSAKRKKKFVSEAKEAESARRELGIDGDDSLVMAITKRQAVRQDNFHSLIDNLEKKYSQPKNSKKNKRK